MNHNGFAELHTGQPLPCVQIPQRPLAEFCRAIVDAVARGHRVAALFGDAAGSTGFVDLYAVLADSTRGLLRVAKTTLDANHFSSMTSDCPQVHLFEREIAE